MEIHIVGNNSVNLYLLKSPTHNLLIDAGLPAETPIDKKQQVESKDLGNGATGLIITEFGWQARGIMIERSKRGLEQTLANIDKVFNFDT